MQDCKLCLQVHGLGQILWSPRILLIPLLTRLRVASPRLSCIITWSWLGLWRTLLLVIWMSLYSWLATRTYNLCTNPPSVDWYGFTVCTSDVIRYGWWILFVCSALLQPLLLDHELDSILGWLLHAFIEGLLATEIILPEILLGSVLLEQHLVECQLLLGQHVALNRRLLSLTCIRLRSHRLSTLSQCLREWHLSASRVMHHLICIWLGISTTTLPWLVTLRQLVHVLDVAAVKYWSQHPLALCLVKQFLDFRAIFSLNVLDWALSGVLLRAFLGRLLFAVLLVYCSRPLLWVCSWPPVLLRRSRCVLLLHLLMHLKHLLPWSRIASLSLPLLWLWLFIFIKASAWRLIIQLLWTESVILSSGVLNAWKDVIIGDFLVSIPI